MENISYLLPILDSVLPQGDKWCRWLFLSSNNKWYVGKTEDKDARKDFGWARTAVSVADGTLPYEAPAGRWEVGTGGHGMQPQPAVTVTAAAGR